ncbi:MAG: histidine kinase [Pyrinomonadaceae bacterium]
MIGPTDRFENFLTTKRFVGMKWFIFWVLLTFVGILFTGSLYVSKIAQDETYSILSALNSQMLRFQIWAVFSLLIILLNHLFRKKYRKWKYLFPLHFVSSVIWAFLAAALLSFGNWLIGGFLNPGSSSFAGIFNTSLVPNLVLGIVGYKIILTTNVAIDYYEQFNRERTHSANLEKQLAQAQLQALKMQLQPHFLFNTLNSVSDLTLEDPRRAVTMISRLGDFLRMTINSSENQKVSLLSELEFIKSYLEIEKIRFRDRLKLEFDIEEQTLAAEIPNLILQPLAENAVKHGIAKTISAEKIKFTSRRAGNALRIVIENDGITFGQNGFSKEGVGIPNTRGRLRQIYGSDFTFKLFSRESGGAQAVLEIPFRAVEDPEVVFSENGQHN